MNEEEVLYDGPSTENSEEEDQESLTLGEERVFDRKLKTVGERMRRFVKDYSNRNGDIELLKEAVKRAVSKRKNKGKEEEKKSMQDREDTIGITEKSSLQKLPTGETENNLPAVLDGQSLSLERVSSDSMNLLDSSAKRLHDSLVKMLPEKGEEAHNEMKKPDNHTIQVACHVAHEITNLMRLKLDVMKFAKTFEK